MQKVDVQGKKEFWMMPCNILCSLGPIVYLKFYNGKTHVTSILAIEQIQPDVINECDCILDIELVKKALLWYCPKEVWGRFYIIRPSKYPLLQLPNYKRISVHKLIIRYQNREKDLGNLTVHHINGNTEDARIENLQLLTREEHSKVHGFN
ncbi:MAG: HNH endonuclease [SAR324 cluster bacterium]|nr:HNH endonuclease [SAR324 cluster bacterium]